MAVEPAVWQMKYKELLKHMIFMEKPHQNAPNSLHVFTFTLHALAKETLEQALAVLADSGTGVGVNGERVRDFNPSQHHLLHPDRPAAPRQDPLPRLLMGPLLLGLEGWGKLFRDDGQKEEKAQREHSSDRERKSEW